MYDTTTTILLTMCHAQADTIAPQRRRGTNCSGNIFTTTTTTTNTTTTTTTTTTTILLILPSIPHTNTDTPLHLSDADGADENTPGTNAARAGAAGGGAASLLCSLQGQGRGEGGVESGGHGGCQCVNGWGVEGVKPPRSLEPFAQFVALG